MISAWFCRHDPIIVKDSSFLRFEALKLCWLTFVILSLIQQIVDTCTGWSGLVTSMPQMSEVSGIIRIGHDTGTSEEHNFMYDQDVEVD